MSKKITAYAYADSSLSLLADPEFNLDGKPPSKWEESYVSTFGRDYSVLRNILKGTLVHREFTFSQIQWYTFRYYHGLFDSVGRFFVMVDVLIPTLVDLPPPVVVNLEGWEIQVPFRDSMARQNEVSPGVELYSSMKDLDYGLLQTFKFDRPDLLMRSKLNGTPFFRVRWEKKTFFVGSGVGYHVPDDFPVAMAEWTHEGFHVLHPFGFPSMTVLDNKFLSHDWEAVDATKVRGYDHGVVFNDNGIEIRSRREPTVEIDTSLVASLAPLQIVGTWEVSWRNGAFFPLRPRPGKPPMVPAKARDALSFAVPCGVLTLPVSLATVRSIVSGPFVSSYGSDEKGLWFDSGVRVAQSPTVWNGMSSSYTLAHKGFLSNSVSISLAGDIYHQEFVEGTVSTPYQEPSFTNVVSGSKVLFFDMGGNSYLIKDKGKSLDMVGGKIESGESSYDALLREVEEETGITGIDPRFVCISSQLTSECKFHSMVYICPLPVGKEHLLHRFPEFSFPDDCVPWIPRLTEAIRSRCGGKGRGLFWLYSTLPPVPYRKLKVLYDTRGHSPGTYIDRKTIRKKM